MFLHFINFFSPRRAATCGIFLWILISPALSTGISPASSAILSNPLQAEVISIQDGDTIELKYIFTGKQAGRRANKPLRIRFLHINCPERGQPFYKVARQFTSQKCFRKTVQIKHEGKFDKYGRLLGEVVLPDHKVLNMELVKAGYAVHFKKYSSDVTYAMLENQAKKSKLGIWGFVPQHDGKL